ncbi:SpoIIE family protein phosphatase [bacterium]|nr:SpoIIE family protein phosphatase [bacterium]
MRTWSGLVISALLLLLAMCYTVCFLPSDLSDWWGHTIQELLCFVAAIVGLIWIMRQSYFERLGLMQKLRLISGFVLLLWGLIRLFSGAYPLEIYYDTHVFGRQIVWLALQISLVAVICIIILSILKSLAFVQQGRGTARNFNGMIFMLFLVTVSAFIPHETIDDWEFEQPFFFYGNTVQIIAQSLLVFTSFIIGFRCKWMHYLNRQKKILSTGIGIVLLLLIIQLIPMLPGVAIQYSVILSAFIKGTIMILLIYGSMSVWGLILQLPSAGLMDRRMQDIQSLQQISATIGTVYNRKDLMVKTSELALEILNGDFTWIELKKQDGYEQAAISGIESSQIQAIEPNLCALRQAVQEKGEVFMIHDISRSRFFRHGPKWHFKGGSLLMAVLRFKHEIIGFMAVGKQNAFGFVEESRGLFRAFCDQVAVALENVRLVELSIEREVYKEELRVAHQAQMRLLPQEVPQISDLDVDGFCLTANDIGGDFYDYILMSDRRLDIVIGDVSGKGAAAAFYMAELKGVLQSLAPHFESPKDMLVQINDFLCNHMESNMFVTMIYMIFNFSRNQVRFARAGHEPVCYFHDKQMKWIEKKGIGLGLVSGSQFEDVMEEEVLSLDPDDGLFLYTDGLIEARNQTGEEFGRRRLNALLNDIYDMKVKKINETIQKKIKLFCQEAPQQDDMTAVMIRYYGQSE